MADAATLARMFKVLSVDTRVRILQLLRQQPLCVMALAERLGVTQAAVSQHLRVLRDARAVDADKRGCFVHYHINEATLEEWARLAEDLLGPEA
jgi:DNA-binding transcriptional ArsR family regulator